MFSGIAFRRSVLLALALLLPLAVPVAGENLAPAASKFHRLFFFEKTNGDSPIGLAQGTDGNFYGATVSGGANQSDQVCGQNIGCGTLFKMTATGQMTTLYNFCALANCADGAFPSTTLVLAVNGNFYGVTSQGGTAATPCPFIGCGTVFQITPAGELTTLHDFCTQTGCPDGDAPNSLVLGSDGNFYGTTFGIGSIDTICNAPECGTVFQITPTGTLTTLHTFCTQTGCPDGSRPNQLVQGSDGNLYGTTQAGGASDGGTVFQITLTGDLTTLHSFCSLPNCADGAQPTAGLVQGNDGNFYGTASLGGEEDEGTVFKISSSGQFAPLHTFCSPSSCPTGGIPLAGLTLGSDGNFYGTTTAGGGICDLQQDCGAVFEITPNGQTTTIFDFCPTSTECDDARFPGAGILQSTTGTFFSTTLLGGNGEIICEPYGCGTFYRITTGLGSFVAFVNGAGAAGTEVGILGQGFSGATKVSFNGVEAQFTVQSNTYITATVPNGATTGTVTVTTADGSLKSNIAFQVAQ
jgi:uncharacterized repeat protein (TIGR03803 family)